MIVEKCKSMKARKYTTLWVAVIILFLAQAGLQDGLIFKYWSKNYSPAQGGLVIKQLSPIQIALNMLGFREFLAGILWVRADGFFDSGNYDAILPIIRICTILDPHNIDIYATGMWHIGYNFTDEDQHSDRRYIPIALALGKEGVENNPNTYELYFENGWMWFNKIQDDPWQAVKWFKEAASKPDILPAREDLLANAYFENGQIMKGLDTYYKLYDKAVKRAKADSQFSNTQIRDTISANMDNTIIRMLQRGYFAEKRNDGSYQKGDYDTLHPFNVHLSAKVTVLRPRVLSVEGTWDVLPVGTHLRFILRDLHYPNAGAADLDWTKDESFNFDLPTNRTFLQEGLFVKDRKFSKEIDMSKDISMYPCVAKHYLLEIYYNPRYAPPHLQDKFGWNGEGITDTHYLNTKIRPNTRCIYCTLELSRNQLLMRGRWTNRHASVQTPNFKNVNVTQSETNIVNVPSIRN